MPDFARNQNPAYYIGADFYISPPNIPSLRFDKLSDRSGDFWSLSLSKCLFSFWSLSLPKCLFNFRSLSLSK